MKIAIVTDTHFGCRNDSQLFLNHQIDFFKNVFIPTLEERGIDTVIHGGDLLDRRKYVNFNTLNTVRQEIIEPLMNHGVTMHVIIGNHDTYYKNTNAVNSIKEVFDDRYENFHLYEEPATVEFDGMEIALLPWINTENEQSSLDFIKNTSAQWLIGHLELEGYEVLRGVAYNGGTDPETFARFEQVLSGHFHCRQERGNVIYMGTPYQITFADSGETKGFWILDTDTREMEFIENPECMFHSLSYDDEANDYTEFIKKTHDMFANKYVKLYVQNKTNPYILDRVVDTLYNSGVYNLTIVDDIGVEYRDIEAADATKSTLEIIMEEIDTRDDIHNKDVVKRLVKEVYMETITS